MQISETTGRRVLITLLVILVLGLVILLWLISSQLEQAKKEVGKVELISPTVTSTTTSTTSVTNENIQVTYSLVADENTDLVKDVVNKFMLARLERNYEEAGPYMTDDLKNELSQEAFAGTSSPSMDRFEITSTDKKDDNTYTAQVISYWKLNGEDADTVKYTLELVKKDSDFLVNKFD